MIEPGTIVRGNWSSIKYRVDHVWKARGEDYWCINGKAVSNPLWSGSFSHLEKRVGNEILVGGPHPPGDRLFIIKEPKSVVAAKQMELDL